MNTIELLKALDDRVKTVTGLPQFHPENVRDDPQTGVPYSRSTLSPAETTRLSNEKDLVNGIYLVDLFYPTNRGADAALAMAGAVLAKFTRGTVLNEGATTVHVVMSWREAAQTVGQFYQVQVVVRYESEQPRQ